MISNRTFLWWIHQRLVYVHGENPNFDYMWKLRAIIDAYPFDEETPTIIDPAISAEAMDRHFSLADFRDPVIHKETK